MSEKFSVAYLNAIKSSPQKVSRVTRNLIGYKVSDALKVLQFSNLKVSGVVRSLIYSAMSNAENNHGLDVDELVVAEAYVGKNLVLKRFHARGRGRGASIFKPFSQLTIVVREVEAKEEAPKKAAAKTKTAAKRQPKEAK